MTSEAHWLIVGHGSVGSFVAERLIAAGGRVSILDPNPRIPITSGVEAKTIAANSYDYVVSCVPPDVAEDVPKLLRGGLISGGLFFDWNTIAPRLKQLIAENLTADVIDVALLDTVDGTSERPLLAISGSQTARAAALLEASGFDITIAGSEVGQAAALKYLRSIFMKTLEALVIEFAALASDLDPNQIVRTSIEHNLGDQFVAFADLLLVTNRVHAERRGGELADAVATFADDGLHPELAAAASGVLRQAGEAWASDLAPPEDSSTAILANHLRRTLWRESAST